MKKTMTTLSAFLLATTLFVCAASAAEFTDVPATHWAYTSIQNVSEQGIMKGLGTGEFKPEGTITRADENINKNGQVTADISAIKDYEDVPVKYSRVVAQAYAKGLPANTPRHIKLIWIIAARKL